MLPAEANLRRKLPCVRFLAKAWNRSKSILEHGSSRRPACHRYGAVKVHSSVPTPDIRHNWTSEPGALDAELFHAELQCRSVQSQLFGCTVWSSKDPVSLFQSSENMGTFGLFQCLRLADIRICGSTRKFSCRNT